MPQFRVADPDGSVVAESEFNDTTAAYDWFKTQALPDDSLGYTLQVEQDGRWKMLETSDGGTNTEPSADA